MIPSSDPLHKTHTVNAQCRRPLQNVIINGWQISVPLHTHTKMYFASQLPYVHTHTRMHAHTHTHTHTQTLLLPDGYSPVKGACGQHLPKFRMSPRYPPNRARVALVCGKRWHRWVGRIVGTWLKVLTLHVAVQCHSPSFKSKICPKVQSSKYNHLC